jgi:hypothetical protein
MISDLTEQGRPVADLPAPADSDADEVNRARLAKLDQCRLATLENPPERPPMILSYKDKRLGEAGSIVVIQGKAKSGKTAVVGAILGAAIGGEGDFFGMESPNPLKKAVLHFDTEQSRYEHFDVLDVSVRKRAKFADIPKHLHSYTMLQLEIGERWKTIQADVERRAVQHDGVHLVVLDGVADLVNDPNDASGSFSLVHELQAFADRHQCLIVAVLHENPGSGRNKTRGHLGSQMERKARTSISVEKDGSSEIVQMYEVGARTCSWPKREAVCFQYDAEAGMHVTVDNPNAMLAAENGKKAEAEKANALQALAMKVLSRPLTHGEFIKAIMAESACKESTAKSRIREMSGDLKIVEKISGGLYQITAEVAEVKGQEEDKNVIPALTLPVEGV